MPRTTALTLNLPSTDRMIDSILGGYVEAAFFCGVFDAEGEYLDDMDADSMTLDSLSKMRETVEDFVTACLIDLGAYCRFPGVDASCVGHDLWLTQNGHGTGFWDRGMGAVGDRLTAMAEPYGDANLYLMDDGSVVCEG